MWLVYNTGRTLIATSVMIGRQHRQTLVSYQLRLVRNTNRTTVVTVHVGLCGLKYIVLSYLQLGEGWTHRRRGAKGRREE